MEHQKFVAVDPQILIGLTLGVPDHLTAVSFFRGLRFLPLITPTVYATIQDALEHGDQEEVDLMQRVLQDIDDSDIVVQALSDTYRQVIDIHANKILEKNVIPGGCKADALYLAEAAYFDATTLLTISRPLRDAQADSLKVALLDCGMDPLHVISPGQIATYLDYQDSLKKGIHAVEEPAA